MHSQMPRFLVYQYTALGSGAVDGHQNFTGSVVRKALTIDPEISPTTSLIFTEGQKLRNLASFSTSLNLTRPR